MYFFTGKKSFSKYTPHFIDNANVTVATSVIFKQKVVLNSKFMTCENRISKAKKGVFDPVIFGNELEKVGWIRTSFIEDDSSIFFINSVKKPTAALSIGVHYQNKPKEFDYTSETPEECVVSGRSAFFGDSGNLPAEDDVLFTNITFGFICKQSIYDEMNNMILSLCNKFEMVEEIDEPEDRKYASINYIIPTSEGANSFNRSFKTYPFKDTSKNYSSKVKAELEWSMNYMSKRETHAGKLFIFHGRPGTGKTFAIRSIISDHRSIYASVFIQPFTCLQNIAIVLEGIADAPSRKIPLLIFEDIGQVLQQDSKSNYPEIVTHILNLTDGLLNHIAESYIIVTFNEKIKDMHEALTRPGRTASIIEFDYLSHKQSEKLVERELPKRDYSLAEIFAIKSGNIEVLEDASKSIGFHK